MLKKVFYKIFVEEKLIIEYFNGPVSWTDLVEMKRNEVAEPNYNPNYSVITDVREAILNLSDLDNVSQYIDFLKSNIKSIGNRRTAILTTNTEQVIFSELLKAMNENLPISLKTVSTYDGVFEWLQLTPKAAHTVRNYLENLTSEFYTVSTN